MLAILTGPVPMLTPYGPVIHVRSIVWSEDMGCAVCGGYTERYGFGLYAVQLDGTAMHIGERINGGMGYYHLDGGLVTSAYGGILRRVNMPSTAERSVPGAPLTQSVVALWYVWSYGVLWDRAIFARGTGIYAVPYARPQVTVEEATGFMWCMNALMPCGAGECNFWWVAGSGSCLQKYDVKNKKRVGKVYGGFGPWDSVAYSIKNDVFVSVYGSQLTVWANEPVPARLSSPVLGGAPRRGARLVVASTLTGSHGEPCPNRVVSFGATGGTIERTPIWTDQYGVAATVVRCADPGTLNVVATFDED